MTRALGDFGQFTSLNQVNSGSCRSQNQAVRVVQSQARRSRRWSRRYEASGKFLTLNVATGIPPVFLQFVTTWPEGPHGSADSPHSTRSTTTGSTRDAARAGSQEATSATMRCSARRLSRAPANTRRTLHGTHRRLARPEVTGEPLQVPASQRLPFPHEPPRHRKLTLPPPARRQSGGVVPVGIRCARARRARGQADPAQHWLRCVSL